VTWKPQLAESPHAEDTLVFDSSKIPARSGSHGGQFRVLKDNPKLGKALTGAWYETLTVMLGKDARPPRRSNPWPRPRDRLAGFKGQLATTYLYATRPAPCAADRSPDLVKKMDLVRTFSFNHGLLGEGAKSVDVVGIEFPGGTTLGNKANVKMRFDPAT
jgi:NitT/TauT family transport system substrate-binding protein